MHVRLFSCTMTTSVFKPVSLAVEPVWQLVGPKNKSHRVNKYSASLNSTGWGLERQRTKDIHTEEPFDKHDYTKAVFIYTTQQDFDYLLKINHCDGIQQSALLDVAHKLMDLHVWTEGLEEELNEQHRISRDAKDPSKEIVAWKRVDMLDLVTDSPIKFEVMRPTTEMHIFFKVYMLAVKSDDAANLVTGDTRTIPDYTERVITAEEKASRRGGRMPFHKEKWYLDVRVRTCNPNNRSVSPLFERDATGNVQVDSDGHVVLTKGFRNYLVNQLELFSRALSNMTFVRLFRSAEVEPSLPSKRYVTFWLRRYNETDETDKPTWDKLAKYVATSGKDYLLE